MISRFCRVWQVTVVIGVPVWIIVCEVLSWLPLGSTVTLPFPLYCCLQLLSPPLPFFRPPMCPDIQDGWSEQKHSWPSGVILWGFWSTSCSLKGKWLPLAFYDGRQLWQDGPLGSPRSSAIQIRRWGREPWLQCLSPRGSPQHCRGQLSALLKHPQANPQAVLLFPSPTMENIIEEGSCSWHRPQPRSLLLQPFLWGPGPHRQVWPPSSTLFLLPFCQELIKYLAWNAK